MHTVYADMIEFTISNTTNTKVKKGLEIALELFRNSGYYNFIDWGNMTDKEKMEELQEYIK